MNDIYYRTSIIIIEYLYFKIIISLILIKYLFFYVYRIDLGIVDSFGWNLGNGSFSGLTGQLQREEIDFGGIGSFIRSDRMYAIDYTVGTFYRQ